MNEQNKTELFKFWLNVASYYRQNIPDETIKMYVYHCRDFSIEEIRAAFEKHCESSEAKFFPLPVVLKNIIRPPFDEEAEANEVVAKIISCMKPFKSSQDARETMGELAWSVVQGVGGWSYLGSQPPPDSFAQRDMREMAKSKIVRAQQGRADEKPALPGSNRLQIPSQTNETGSPLNENVRALVSDTMKGKSLN
jgi:hypothetical protein